MTIRSGVLSVATILLSMLFPGTAHAQQSCTVVLDPGVHQLVWRGSTGLDAAAQTFTPSVSGSVCEIQHAVTNAGSTGLTYDLYVVNAPGVGAPPTDFATPGNYLFRATGQTDFVTGAGRGRVDVTNLTLNAGQRYALIIVPHGGTLTWIGNNTNGYVGGQSYILNGGAWGSTIPFDFGFCVFGTVPPPPSNNACGNCQPIGAGNVNGTLVGTTNDGSSSCGGSPDAWYCYTPPCSGLVSVNTCSATFDTVLSVHTGCPGTTGNQIVCNDDCPGTPCSGTGSCVQFNAICGATYRIRVASFDGSTGTYTLALTQAAPTPPSNDNIASAIVIGNVSNLGFSTCGATPDGPVGCNATNDIWYRYTPSCQGTVSVDLCGSSYDTYLAVYTGTPGNLALVAGTCNDDNGPLCSGLSSSARFAGNPCVSYYIRIGGWAGRTGCGDLSVSCSNSTALNDACASAIPIAAGVTFGTTIGATATTAGILTPPPCGASAGTRDVWYKYKPPCNGLLTLDTCPVPCVGSRYDTVLSVYTGSCGGPLNQVGACNDDSNACGTGYFLSSRVAVNVTGGVEYKIRVSGYAGLFGNYAIQLAFSAPPLTNDLICNATPIPCGTSPLCTVGATTSPESAGCTFFNDVWFQFTTPGCGGPTTVSTCGSLFNTVLAVYSGTCGSPTQIACNDNAPPSSGCAYTQQSSVSFIATGNTTYFVRVGAPVNTVTGTGVITVSCPTQPALPACPPLTGGAISKMFSVSGPASGAPWAFRLTVPCCFDLYVASVPGVAASGTQSTDEANLRNAFVAAINTACPATPFIATAYPFGVNGVTEYGKFGIKARHCGTNVAATLSVGAAGTAREALCTVLPESLPTTGPCSFNPDIVELELSGIDCNANGEDDYVDIVSGASLDVDGNNVPDECPIPPDQAGIAYCFGDGLGAQPTTPCPCGNVGAAGNGCASSFNPAGANLIASGKPAFDDVVLTISGTNSSPGVVVFTANNAIDPNGLPFGDGITCGGGSLVRLRGVATLGGAASFPVPPETITLSQRTLGAFGTFPGSGVTVSYSAFYRNSAAAFCPPFTFNGPNNYLITW